MVAGSNLVKYSVTAALDSARLILFTCLLHEKGMARAWVARPSVGRRVKRCMVTTMVGGYAMASTLPFYQGKPCASTYGIYWTKPFKLVSKSEMLI